MKKSFFKEVLFVPIITILIELIITKIFETKTLKEILITIIVATIVSAFIYILGKKILYKFKRIFSLFVNNKQIKVEFEKYYDTVYKLYECKNYQNRMLIFKLSECVDYIFNLFLNTTEDALNDKIKQNLVENIQYICIEDYVNKCKEIISSFVPNNNDDQELIIRLNNKINNVEAQLIMLGYENIISE